MSFSKIWRKGRWFWYCSAENNASNWKDHWACGAQSRGTWTTEDEAKKAGRNHRHNVNVIQIHPCAKNKRGRKRK